MNPFDYRRVQSEAQAFELTRDPLTSLVAGATDFMQLWKAGLEVPKLVIDIGALPYHRIEVQAGQISIGALATMSEVAAHSTVRSEFPMIAEALLASASPQVRNAATIG